VADAPAPSTAKNPLEILKQKIGPLPLWVWLGAGAAIWWYFQRQQAGGSGSAVPNQQTDPAGNIGSIDPATGYVYGTPEDNAALAANNAGTSSPTTGAGSGGTSGAQTYADNNTWGEAAINYLVGLGIDPTTANQAVTLYLASQSLTSAQQGDVNLAIQALGPPPSLPGPVQTNPTPITTPGGGGTGGNTPKGATPVVSGGHVVSVNATRAVVAWNATNATTFKVKITGPGKINGFTNTINGKTASYSGLESGHTYTVNVQPIVGGKPAGESGDIELKTK
jgi:hypothetical protein